MKITKTFILAFIATIVLTITLMLFLFFSGEQQKTSFATYDDLITSGYLEKGWLPPFLPESSKNIIETHNLDTNIVKAVFDYERSDTQGVEDVCREKTAIENGVEYRCEHEGRSLLIKLMDNGEGYLYSSPTR